MEIQSLATELLRNAKLPVRTSILIGQVAARIYADGEMKTEPPEIQLESAEGERFAGSTSEACCARAISRM